MTKTYTLLTLVLIVGMSSCSSSRNAQNSDDLYYSDGSKKAAAAGANDASSKGDYYSTAPSDNYVRMKATDPDRWSYFDDYNAYDSYYYSPVAAGYGYPSYGFGYGLGYGSGLGFGYGLGFGMGYGLGFYDPYFAWNCWYNPYFYNPHYGGAVLVTGHSLGGPVYSNLRPFNSMAYRNGVATKSGNTAGRFYRQGMSGTSAYNSSLNGSGRTTNTYRSTNNNSGGNTYRPASNVGSGGGFRPSGGGGGFRPSGGGGGFRH